MNFAHAEVATLDPTTMRTLCEEYMANNYIDPETSERLGVKVCATRTAPACWPA